MTKVELVKSLMERTGLSKNQAVETVELFLDSIKNALRNGEKVCLVGFGAFHVKEKKARSGRNPKTGQTIEIPPKRVAIFKPGKAFREMVND